MTISDDVNTAENISSDKHPSESKVLPSSGGNVQWYKQAPSGELYALSNKVDIERYDARRIGDQDDENKAIASGKDEDEAVKIYCLAKEMPETDE